MKASAGSIGGQEMASVLDKELSDPTKDAFGHQHFSDALRNLIESPHRPPFSIGLLGSWGTGKSTIKELYLTSLAKDSSGPNGKRRRNRFRPVTFNAWRYGAGEDIKRALLRHVFLRLGGDDVELRRKLYQQVTDTAQSKRSLGEWFREAALQNVASALLFLVLFALIMGTMWLVSYGLGLSDQLGLTVVLTAAAAVAAFLGKYVVDIRLKSPTLFTNQTVISFPATSAEEYERLLVDQIRKFRAKPEGRSCERLVIFVDDLDRLSAVEMVAGLDAVRTFLELPLGEVSDDFGVIFVISCDEDRVADALSRGRGRVNPDLPGSVFTRSDARRYLDRLFQFRLEIPPFPKLDMRHFAEEKLRQSSLAAEIEKGGVRLQDLVERLIHVGVQSPRNAIQILNAFTQSWWMAVQRERSGIGSTAPGALYDGAVTSHPLALAALCVLRADFPDFYGELQSRPELIQEFNRVVFRGEAFDSLAVSAQHALKEFLVVEDGKVGNDVRSEHRNLRQYLSSLLDLRWPKSLQPLLLLAQDAISRRLGDRAAELNDAFVSGDTRGVMEVLGHHLDNDDLSHEDVRLLEDLAEGLSDETQARRVNAARVLAAIAHRIPAAYRNGLMVPLARQMIGIKDIRTNVGPAAAKEIIAALSPEDRREVAESFSGDLLTGQKLEWRLPTGQTPNLEELVSDVRAAAELVLTVRATDQLLPVTESRVRSWLLSREVQSSQGAQTLPFAQLETWMNEHEEHLLRPLGSDYTQLAVDELENNPAGIPDIDRMLQRVSQVYKALAEAGEESREELWEQLTRLVAVRSSDGALTAWKEAGSYASLATPKQARTFLVAFANRLHREMEDGDQRELDWQAGSQQLLDLATRWEANLDQESAAGVFPLLQSWSGFPETSDYMSRAAEILMRRDQDSWHSLMGYITNKPFGELPWPSLAYVASHLDDLTEETLAALVGQMNAVVNGDKIETDTAEKYRKFIDATAAMGGWSSNPLSTHTKTSRARILAMSTQADYLSEFFPAARKLLRIAPKGQIANVLKPLFEQAAGAPEAYPVLHREMAGHWPEQDEQTGPYDADAIASRAIQFIKENPANSGSGVVFNSIVDMVSRDLVAENIRPGVSDAATILWRYSPGAVAQSMSQIAPFMAVTDIKNLLTGKQPNDPDREDIQTIIDAISREADEQRQLAIARELLVAPPKEINSLPDGALTMWLSSLGSGEGAVLATLLQDDTLNEEQRERVLSYAMSRRRELGLTFFLEVAPIILSRTGEAKPLAILVNGMEDILVLATDSDQKSSLAGALVPTLPNLPKESLLPVARAIGQLGGKGILERDSDALRSMDTDQLDILMRAVPGSKVIRKHLESSGTKATE
ncbi:hypothetical protein KEU06_20725 [Pseudaminobacter sp. 19-2017]|uniref:KAP NTPase domain-containing protein n=1 Tax=Pseudaminobacter soli (ex Zhang et al. 2022) TaxID=2831468 RepID=A0A942DZF2_9HYPH|nr:P-loop NTPase fold protein [Pseudaminobacter soli]MBS3651039.1 hypothetical protein [Pseudaminobacter soli]